MKRILIALALCLLMVGLVASPAFAATQKLTLYNYATGAASGYATFVNDQGDHAVTVAISLNTALPKTKYYVYLAYPGPNDSNVIAKIGSFTTNAKGSWSGQNSQYDFTKTLPAGEYQAQVILENVYPFVENPEGYSLFLTYNFNFKITN